MARRVLQLPGKTGNRNVRVTADMPFGFLIFLLLLVNFTKLKLNGSRKNVVILCDSFAVFFHSSLLLLSGETLEKQYVVIFRMKVSFPFLTALPPEKLLLHLNLTSHFSRELKFFFSVQQVAFSEEVEKFFERNALISVKSKRMKRSMKKFVEFIFYLL